MATSVLIVDDDSAVLSVSTRWLTAAEYEVTALGDFNHAKTLVREGLFDILLVDIRLGEFNGLQLVIEARNRHPSVRIVVMSGWDDASLKRDVAAHQGVFLLKPFSREHLFDAIRSTES
jgi:two-component system response regulator YesN